MACTLESRHQWPPRRFLPIQSYNLCVIFGGLVKRWNWRRRNFYCGWAGGSTGSKDTLQGPHRPKQMTLSLYIYQYTWDNKHICRAADRIYPMRRPSRPCKITPMFWHKGHPTWQNRSQRSSAIVHIIIPLWLLSRSFCSSAKVPPFLYLFDVREKMS